MKVSLNIVKQLTGLDLPDTGTLVERINQRLGGMEEVIDIGAKYKDALIVRVVECEKHPNADKLSVCKIDAGTGELVQVVCGAPNVHANMWAVWLPPESVVPSTYGTAEPFTLGARELRGVMSQGMLAAADELAIGSDHAGIVEISDYDLPEGANLEPGMSFAEIFGLDDVVIDIENKMFTHRPDLFGQLGVAREINAILQDDVTMDVSVDNSFENPEWYRLQPEFANASGLELEVFNDTPENSPRFMAVVVSGVEVRPSPLWLQCQLVVLGAKPINNIVDLTNYMMLITAQPTHAYDYDKLRGCKIGVRMAQPGEKVTLLNDKTYELASEDIVIADGEGAIGLAGVMGGLDSEVTKQTKSIVLEVANFDMYKIRKTSMRHGVFTDAVTRFNKGQSPLQTTRVASRLLELLPGEQASRVYDLPDKSFELEKVWVHSEVLFTADFVNKRLGTDLTTNQIGNILRPANFATYPTDDDRSVLSTTAPFWRTDIELPEDIVEEVGRLYGFDRLPRELPMRAMRAQPRNQTRVVKQLVRESLARQGASEVLAYSFVHEKTLTRAGQDPSIAFRLSNALSPDLQYYRLTVLPSLLDKVYQNMRAGYDEFTLFEIGKGHNKQFFEIDSKLPDETNFIDAVYVSEDNKNGAPYYRMKKIVAQLARDLKLDVTFVPMTSEIDHSVAAPFEQSRSAMVMSAGELVGVVGELKQTVMKNFKLPSYTAAMSLNTRVIEPLHAAAPVRYNRLSRFPGISRDISIKTSSEIRYSQIEAVVRDCLNESSYRVDLSPVARYQSADDVAYVTATLHIELTSYEGTLTDEDLMPLMETLETRIESNLSGTII